MATFWQTPYFFDKLVALPALDLASPLSESDFLLLPFDRTDDFREILGPPESRSFRLNLWLPPSLELTEGALGRVGAGSGVFLAGATTFPPETPADMLGALLAARLGAWLGGLVEGRLKLSHSEGEGVSWTADVYLSIGFSPSALSDSFSSASRVFPGSFGYAPASGEGNG